jgi:hypothetical protein
LMAGLIIPQDARQREKCARSNFGSRFFEHSE